MADNKGIAANDEESNVEEINNFVTGEDSEDISGEKDAAEIEERPVALDDEETVKEEKIAKKEAKPEHKKIVHKSNAANAAVQKKEEHKKSDIKHEHKAEHKPAVHKKIFSKKDKPETKVTESPKPKKSARPIKDGKSRNDKKDSKNILLWIGIGLLAVILIVVLVMLLRPNQQQPPTDNQTTNTVAATVNGEAIYLQDITNQYNNLNPVYQQIYTIESLLNKSIDDLLLFQESKKEGISVSQDTIQKELDAVMTENGLTDEQLKEALARQGMTIESLKGTIEKSISIRELLNKTILQNITVTDTQIKNYYELNKEEFKVPERVTVRHILILTSKNVSNETAKEKIEQIQDELTDDNFCELAKKYSEDLGSKDNCGEYTFAKGDFNNPEFENPSFDLKVGEVAIVHTDFGYHLIKKIASMPAGIMDISEVNDDIKDTLYNQVAQKRFDAMLEGLRNDSEIVNYYTRIETTNTTVVAPLQSNLDDFAKCLTENNATMYGASWCSHCNNQKNMFGESVEYIRFVDCEVGGKLSTECKAANIQGYPTWIINGKTYTGEQTLEKLAQLTGCSLN